MDEHNNQNTNIDSKPASSLWAWIVVAVVIMGVVTAVYFWPKISEMIKNRASDQSEVLSNEPDTTTQALEQVSQSDEVADIETDLSTTDVSNLDKELSDIEAELNQ